ncbi:hypothetical protein [Aliivibrio fischeri]|uniref:hypothetical protein n=1 Tax=Aliivibrio fischeri TaxID=668 RepID=UPI00105F7002|nr:hypothetical protein [Aliivibrio fischeri]TDM51403.1 hypothetical protein VFFQA001_14855 [Aliivibrio fischeri]
MSLSRWCEERFLGHDKVESIEIIESLLRITHENGHIFNVACISEDRTTLDSLSGIDVDNIDFLLNIKKDAYIVGDVYALANSAGFGIGGLGDAFRALALGGMAGYLDAEMEFVIPGLRQHSRVNNIQRLDNRRFYIERDGLPPVIILVLNDYDLTSASVRNGITTFGEFQAILTSNPNCRRSTSSQTAADSAGIKLLSWGELMGDLNRVWT